MFKSDGGSEEIVGSKRKRVNSGNDRRKWVLSGRCENKEVMDVERGRRRSEQEAQLSPMDRAMRRVN